MIDVYVTPRFERHFERYNGIRSFVYGKVAELIKKRDADATHWSWDLEKLKDASFGSVQVYRIPITSRDRLVFVIEDRRIILADIGDHDVMDDYSRIPNASRKSDLTLAKEPAVSMQEGIKVAASKVKSVNGPNLIHVGPILTGEIDSAEERWVYEEELNEEWVQFLDEPQTKVVDEILIALDHDNDELLVFFVNGGPGTGKTVVLLNLAFRLQDAGRSFSFQLNDQVVRYLNRGQQKVPGVDFGFGPGVIMLLDDPASIEEFADAIRKAKTSRSKALIVGFDPLQWHERKMEERFSKICENTRYQYFPLWVCYRQSYGVAKKTLELTEKIFTDSSRFLSELKITTAREEIRPHLDLTLGMEFVDSAGRWKIYSDSLVLHVLGESQRVKARIDLWKHTHAICIVYEDGLDPVWRKQVKDLFQGTNRLDISLDRYQKIRGVEFQELFLFLSEEFWNRLTKGQMGLSSDLWEKLTSLHTIFSRAKDSLVIFVVPNAVK